MVRVVVPEPEMFATAQVVLVMPLPTEQVKVTGALKFVSVTVTVAVPAVPARDGQAGGTDGKL